MPNILEVLGVASKEDVISNLLRFCIAESCAFRRAFITVIGGELRQWHECSVRTRTSIPGVGIPDVAMGLESEEGSQLFIIENKLGAEEGEDQTERYGSASTVAALATRLGLRHQPAVRLVFLTLFPDQSPRSSRFTSITYQALRDGVREYKRGENQLADQLASALFDVLDRFYAEGAVTPTDEVMEHLSRRGALEGEYLYFRNFISLIELRHGLEHPDFFKQSNPGRRYYGAVISKAAWQPAAMEIDAKSGQLIGTFEPRRHFNIHFELQHGVLNGAFRIYLHYEISPYNTEKWAKANLPSDRYGEYKAIRAQFENSLRTAAIPGLVVGAGGSNQVARADVSLQGKKVGEAVEIIRGVLERVTPTVDRLLPQ